MERRFSVSVYDLPRSSYGLGWAKFEPLFDDSGDRFLVLDSDTVLLGRILDVLEKFDEDFIVTGVKSDNCNHPLIVSDYVKVQKIVEFDNTYKYPGFGFNTGQVVGCSGKLTRADFANVVDYSQRLICCKYKDVFPYNDQGVFNYVLAKRLQQGAVTVRYHDFMIWSAALTKRADITPDSLRSSNGLPYVAHWAGMEKSRIRKMIGRDILRFYERYYYANVSHSFAKRWLRAAHREIYCNAKIVLKPVLGYLHS